MEIKKVTQVHFSPSGTTRKTAEALSESFGLPVDGADTAAGDPSVTRRFGADKLVIFCLPVFAGRLPEFCPKKLLSQFTGSDTPALAVVVYGNRDYEDALLEELAGPAQKPGLCTGWRRGCGGTALHLPGGRCRTPRCCRHRKAPQLCRLGC